MLIVLALSLNSTYAADLAPRIDAIVKEAPAAVRGSIGIHVVDLATGNTVYALNDRQLFLPASNMKLFTAALALTRLGPDYRFTTQLVQESSGDLALLGSGDPSLSGRAYPYQAESTPGNSLTAIEELAELAVAAGVREVNGNIIGDDRRFAWSPYPPSWTTDDILHDYGAPVSALTLNDNTVALLISPGGRPGDLARVAPDPAVEYFTIDNRVTTASGERAAVRVQRVPGSRQILLSGSIGSRAAAVREIVAVDDPARFAAQALYDALLRRGVTIRGTPAARHGMAPPDSTAPGKLIASRTSPPLSELLQTMIKVSQNLHAELILREIGRSLQGEGTLDAGLREMQAFLSESRIPQAEWRSEDGSGLARNDQVAPRALTRLLRNMAVSGFRETWLSLFPIGGVDGTLSNRLCCIGGESRIRAKTGSLSRAISLSGYADSRANGRLAFAVLVNNFAAPSAETRAMVDKIALSLVE